VINEGLPADLTSAIIEATVNDFFGGSPADRIAAKQEELLDLRLAEARLAKFEKDLWEKCQATHPDTGIVWRREINDSLFDRDWAPPPAADSPSAVGKGVAPRDVWFLQQLEADGLKKRGNRIRIRDKWNAKKLAEREAICPDYPKTVSLDAVSKGISRARKLRGDKPRKSPIKPKRRSKTSK
jgi:hypothetical protein